MSFIEAVPESEAAGTIRTIYDAAINSEGFLPNYARLFSLRPKVYLAWQTLGGAIRINMTLRRYELVTLAAARQLGSTYCMLAHSDNFLKSGEVDEAQLAAIANDYHNAGLTPEEVAVMEFASKVISNSSDITQSDVDHLKSFGLPDAEILDVTLATAARSFFSKTLDALNAEPDACYAAFSDPLRIILSVGRPFGDVVKT